MTFTGRMAVLSLNQRWRVQA